MSNPLISVIVPVYKVEPYLHRCVDSILEQTFSDFELILVDDGSPDNCGAICDEYAAKDSRVHVIHQQNGGLSAARNAGIDWAFSRSDSTWLSFIDSDDSVLPDYLSRMYTSAAEQDADLCICDFQTVLPDGEIAQDEVGIPSRVDSGTALLKENIIYSNWRFVIACSKLYRKQLFAKLRFPVGYIHEDEAIIHRVLGGAAKVICISDRLYCYYLREESITGTGRTVKSTDYLSALSDRIRYARKAGLTALVGSSVWVYLRFLLETALPLLMDAEHNSRYIKRASSATRAVLSQLLRSKSRTSREKIRVILFSYCPRFYLSIAKRHVKNR